ncbi:hypothetical protein EMIHUDRAFT_104819 [Emiliania huxleyi CCMP1516]|uniref:PPIase cyclophilin-type domain-containing protein n=2 Tax=Emiliania huxleyi TaxID=2903 RepID=A0A0D3IJI2_EMIH1|nr:hypothetical protein EMIHUDRAFT_104819 [Emiliania huxleyi CCMP1516]EOD11417.1 hypothetical protein EMIHUDRAFT_104819 [Emiliania huxleyi CCMP1516]|eukprot:XP_005763846.1 hypothetical protein EMIHUDRAFT_104819 [Emiliania huxleyi CCMP1516]
MVAVYSEGVDGFSISGNPKVPTPVTLREGITLISNSFSLGQNDYVVLTVEAPNALTSISLADLQPRDYVGALLIERLPSPDAPITYEYDFASPNFNQTHPADGLLGWAMLQEDAIGDSILGERAAGSDEVTYYPGASGWRPAGLYYIYSSLYSASGPTIFFMVVSIAHKWLGSARSQRTTQTKVRGQHKAQKIATNAAVTPPPHMTVAHVFGSVTKGMEVVKAIEGVGSQSGKTAKPVMIADCGQIS